MKICYGQLCLYEVVKDLSYVQLFIMFSFVPKNFENYANIHSMLYKQERFHDIELNTYRVMFERYFLLEIVCIYGKVILNGGPVQTRKGSQFNQYLGSLGYHANNRSWNRHVVKKANPTPE